MAFKTFADGDVLTASEVNTYLAKQAVIVCSSSATYPTSPVDGMVVFDEALDSLVVYNGGWVQALGVGAAADTSWSPVITQSGTVTHTATTAVYTRQGHVVQCWADLSVTGSGTTANNITVTLPVTAATHAVGNIIGTATVYDSSGTANYVCAVQLASSTTVLFKNDASQNVGVGTTPAFGLATGDVIRFQATYLVA